MEISSNLRKLALLAGAALLSTGAFAMPEEDAMITETETIKYSIPDSATPQGASVLYRKLKSAAYRVCSGRRPGAKIPQLDGTCFTEALNKAVADVGSPLLLAMHQHKDVGATLAKAEKAQPSEMGTLASR